MKRLIILTIWLVFQTWSYGLAQSDKLVLKSTSSINRQHDVTAYTAGDVIANDTTGGLASRMFEFTNAFNVTGGTGSLVAVLIQTDTANVTNGTLRLFLYSDSSDAGTIYDNSANSVSLAQIDSCEGFIDFTLETTGTASGTTGFDYVILSPAMPVYAENGSKKLWGRLTATGAWTPKHEGKITITLWVDQNE